MTQIIADCLISAWSAIWWRPSHRSNLSCIFILSSRKLAQLPFVCAWTADQFWYTECCVRDSNPPDGFEDNLLSFPSPYTLTVVWLATCSMILSTGVGFILYTPSVTDNDDQIWPGASFCFTKPSWIDRKLVRCVVLRDAAMWCVRWFGLLCTSNIWDANVKRGKWAFICGLRAQLDLSHVYWSVCPSIISLVVSLRCVVGPPDLVAHAWWKTERGHLVQRQSCTCAECYYFDRFGGGGACECVCAYVRSSACRAHKIECWLPPWTNAELKRSYTRTLATIMDLTDRSVSTRTRTSGKSKSCAPHVQFDLVVLYIHLVGGVNRLQPALFILYTSIR